MPRDPTIRTILVATDGSPHSDRVVSLGAELAQLYDAMVIILYAAPELESEFAENAPGYLQKFADVEHVKVGDVMTVIGEEILGRAEAEARAKGAKKILTAMPHGDPAQAILEYARMRDVDLIVMGSRGLGDLKALMLGSVSHKVSQLAPCSCITMR